MLEHRYWNVGSARHICERMLDDIRKQSPASDAFQRAIARWETEGGALMDGYRPRLPDGSGTIAEPSGGLAIGQAEQALRPDDAMPQKRE
jgi:hypothetical protein